MNLIRLFISGILTENIVLVRFLGICPFIGTSRDEKSALGMGVSVGIVTVLSSIITYIINKFILIPTNTVYLQTIIFILIISCMVQIISIIIKNKFNTLYKLLGIYLPLITTNCAVLGIALLNVNNNYSFLEMLVNSISSSLGFIIVIYIFSTMRENIESCESFKGIPIAFMTAGIMSLIFGRIL